MSKQLIKGTDGVVNTATNLEERKLKALEKIANSLDALTLWFEEVDKDEWSNRIQYYLSEWHKIQLESKNTEK